MLRTTLASSRVLRVCVFGLVAVTTAVIFTTDNAEARHLPASVTTRARHHQEARESYSPAFSSIIVDGNSGATLSSNNPDASRHPASLTKIMTLYLLFERLDAGKMKLDTRNAGFRTRLRTGSHQARTAPGPDHPRRGRHQGTGDALGQ